MAKVNINSEVTVKAYREGEIVIVFIVDGKEIECPVTQEKFDELMDSNFFIT